MKIAIPGKHPKIIPPIVFIPNPKLGKFPDSIFSNIRIHKNPQPMVINTNHIWVAKKPYAIVN